MKTIDELKLSDPIVHQILGNGGNLEGCICALSDQNAQLVRRIIELESIAPKKIKTPDGQVMVWHCPDNLVPESVH
jgi:hypothetical protein